MIYGIGTDIVRVSRMVQNLEQFGERFASRILAEEELAGFRKAPHRARFLAKRFAAKEAVVKALGTGFRNGISLHHVAVRHDDLGRPLLYCAGRLRELMNEFGVGEGFISLADEEDYAIAFVTFMRAE